MHKFNIVVRCGPNETFFEINNEHFTLALTYNSECFCFLSIETSFYSGFGTCCAHGYAGAHEQILIAFYALIQYGNQFNQSVRFHGTKECCR